MAETDEKVMAAVEAALQKDPDASVDELFAMSKGMNRSIGKLSKRQFHARYPLQVKRRGSAGKPRKARKPRKKATSAAPRQRGKGGEGTRDAIRRSFLNFASELASAEARKDVVRVVSGIDQYVDEVMKATGQS